jgi:hypothetical protein
LIIFTRGIDSFFSICEELANSCSFEGTATGEYLFIKPKKTLAALELG